MGSISPLTPAPLTLTLLWFLKSPIKGLVKSRLAAEVGEDAALELYRRFLLDISSSLKELPFPIKVYFAPAEDGKPLFELLGNTFEYFPQKGTNLGERLLNAFRDTYREGSEKILVIGGDSPEITGNLLIMAMETLKHENAVIGPAHDGGYYLLGIGRGKFHSSVFKGIPWGEETVFPETMNRLLNIGINPLILPMKQDIDTLNDLKELVRNNNRTPFSSSQTMKYAKELLRVYGI